MNYAGMQVDILQLFVEVGARRHRRRTHIRTINQLLAIGRELSETERLRNGYYRWYRRNHRETVSAAQRRWYAENRQRVQARRKESRAAINEYRRAYNARRSAERPTYEVICQFCATVNRVTVGQKAPTTNGGWCCSDMRASRGNRHRRASK